MGMLKQWEEGRCDWNPESWGQVVDPELGRGNLGQALKGSAGTGFRVWICLSAAGSRSEGVNLRSAVG